MQYRNLGVLALAGNALAAYVPSEPWSTLTPSATLQGGATSFSGSFGIAINPIATASSSSVVEKKVNRKAEATQIGDGQIQATTATEKATAQAVTQIGDGQIQASTTTEKATAQAVTQIGDGQIQASTTTEKATAQAVTQIGDGQIQASTTTEKATAQAVTQIGDGQVQATTTTEKSTATAATQIGDGQVQATTAKESATPASQIGDGQVQKETSSAPLPSATENITLQACASNGTLTMTLEDSILKDSKGRIGSIVANKQFQFDGPPPQAGAIYAAGWSISEDGKLAIGNSTTFYQCLSGNFYNLYSEEIGSKCEPVELDIVELVSC